MFRPIKNLISYIQKNASGAGPPAHRLATDDEVGEADDDKSSVADETAAAEVGKDCAEMAPSSAKDSATTKSSIDGGALNVAAETGITVAEMEDVAEEASLSTVDIAVKNTSTQLPSPAAIEGRTANKSKDESVSIAVTDSQDIVSDDDDIERQIQSVVMLKKPFSGMAATGKMCTVKVLPVPGHDNAGDGEAEEEEDDMIIIPDKLADHNQNHTSTTRDLFFMDSNDRQSIVLTPTHQAEEDVCSFVSAADMAAREKTPDVFLPAEVDDEEEEEFLEFAQDIETFPGSEIVVIDADLNSSIASDVPSEDPLAIDDFTQPSLRDANGTLDSSTNDETSVGGGEITWININDIKANDVMMPHQLHHQVEISTHTDGPQKRPPLCSAGSSTGAEKATIAMTAQKTASNMEKSSSEEPAEELRSDGSDSGLGSETSTILQMALNGNSHASDALGMCTTTTITTSTAPQLRPKETTVVGNSTAGTTLLLLPSMATPVARKPLRSNLKRRLDSDDDALDVATSLTSCHETSTTSSTSSSATVASSSQLQKKPKRSINFDGVQVYYFPRQQGFGCVPSAGGCTLGMGQTHTTARTITLAEHAAELRRAHRLQQQELQPRGGGSSSDDSEESEEDYLSEGSGSDVDAESSGFLQPVSPKQRRAILKAAGVRKIDAGEKADCRDIRNSREICGCSCREFCDPETCACSQAGIKCQVDRAMFPCGCTRDACGNTSGRVEFNPQRVRVHFIHTLMRLEMENRQQQNPTNTLTAGNASNSNANSSSRCSAMGIGKAYGLPLGAGTNATAQSGDMLVSSGAAASTAPGGYYGLQPQSNYSSGYASPVYAMNDPAAGYYQLPLSAGGHHHHYGGMSPALTDLQLPPAAAATAHTPPPPYAIDSLDAGLFGGSATGTPSYGEMLPAYGGESVVGGVAASSSVAVPPLPYHSLGYVGTTIDEEMQPQVSVYAIYPQASGELTAPGGLPAGTGVVGGDVIPHLTPTTYSSCAVPSVPPFGTATTTAAAPEYHTDCNVLLATTTAPSCIGLDVIGAGGGNVGGGRSFIDLNTPIASSARLSQINDLLQHNRNTTAALVAVTHASTTCLTMSSATPALASTLRTTNISASIDTPPVDETTLKGCLGFDDLPSPLHPTPIVAVLENGTIADIIPAGIGEAGGGVVDSLSIITSARSTTTTATPALAGIATASPRTAAISINSTKSAAQLATPAVVVDGVLESSCDRVLNNSTSTVAPSTGSVAESISKLCTTNITTATTSATTAALSSAVVATTPADTGAAVRAATAEN